MKMYKFEKDGAIKECHCHEGVLEELLALGWVEVKPKKKAVKKD